MAEMRDTSSVLFSLNQLMKLEQDRVREEELAAMRRAEAEAAARADAERRARLEQEALMRAEEARRRAEEAARREEAARHQAIRLAEAERVRIETEQRARIKLIEQQQEHERRLAAIEHDAQKRRLKNILYGGAVIASLVFGGSAFAYFGHYKPHAEAARQQEMAAIAAYESEVEKLKAEIARANNATNEAVIALNRAHNEAERIKAEQAVADAKKAADQAKKNLSNVRPPPVAKDKPQAKCRYEGDPLCGSLN
jgi:hypothetical protein